MTASTRTPTEQICEVLLHPWDSDSYAYWECTNPAEPCGYANGFDKIHCKGCDHRGNPLADALLELGAIDEGATP